MRRRWFVLGVGGVGIAAGCGEVRAPDRMADSSPPAPTPVPKPERASTVVLDGLPHVRQKPDFCGEACIEMAAKRLGRGYDQDAVFGVTGVDPALGRGAVTRELAIGARALGFEIGAVWSHVDAGDPATGLAAAFAVVLDDLHAGVPTILCTRFDERPRTTEHFRLVVGYDAASDEVVYHEPAADDGAYRRMSRERLLSLWPLKYEDARWTLVSLPLRPRTLVDPPASRGAFSAADYAQHVITLKEKLEGVGLASLSIRIEEPFVVAGNDTPEVLRQRAQTVRWAADMLEQDFFERRPTRILDVFLFNGEASYERGVRLLTGGAPGTPYGFYSSVKGGLFMNIATGGGTLVHEIVHPYVEADLDDAPAWINEGLGSLFEQSGERDGHIVGYTNWRLAGLQRALKKGQVPTFRELASMSDHAFYEEDRGTNYGQARYLMYYLQERGLLRTFYKSYRAAQKTDKSGYKTLVATLGESDMADFQRRWSDFVLGLRFER
jgi:hypothetical protein